MVGCTAEPDRSAGPLMGLTRRVKKYLPVHEVSNESVGLLGVANGVVWCDDDVCTARHKELSTDEYFAVRC